MSANFGELSVRRICAGMRRRRWSADGRLLLALTLSLAEVVPLVGSSTASAPTASFCATVVFVHIPKVPGIVER